METLHITLFGHIKIVHPSYKAAVQITRSSQSLLAYLLLQRSLVSRDVLMDVFWVDDAPDRARSSLTTAIWRLRKLLEPSDVRAGTYLVTNSAGDVGFNWDSNHWIDARSFEEPTRSFMRKPLSDLCDHDVKAMEGTLVLYCGELLEGLYDDWALNERERFHTLYVNCLARLMDYHASKDNVEQCLALGNEILRCDPVREEIHRNLMRMYQKNGQRALAMRQFERCRELLSRELGVTPLEETEMLYRQISTSSITEIPAGTASLNNEVSQLTHDLQLVRRSLDETTQALARIAQVVNRLVPNPERSQRPTV